MSLKTILKTIINIKSIKIINTEFNQETSSLSIHVKMTKGKMHRCPICGKKSSHYDCATIQKRWRSLDFGSFSVFIVSDVHRVNCKVHGVHTEQVPWASHHTNFTKEFEQQVAYLAIRLNKTEVSSMMRINWKTVGSILSRIKNKIEPDSSVRFENITRIGIDETSYRKGHKYVTVVLGHDSNQVIWVGCGTGIAVLDSFFSLLTEEQKAQIKLVSADGAKWIESSIKSWIPHANDKSQPQRKRGRPVKGEGVSHSAPGIKSSKYALGKNPKNTTETQKKLP